MHETRAEGLESGASGRASAKTSAINLVLTATCNLDCAYCYQNSRKATRMDPAVLRRALDLVRDGGDQSIRVAFLGGEPTLAFPLIREAVRYAAATFPPDRGVEYVLVTNGTLLGPDEIEFLVRHAFTLRLSMDGTAPAQDRRGKGTFAVLDRLLSMLRSEYPAFFRDRVSVNATVIPDTVRHLADSVAYFLEKGLHRIVLSPAAGPFPDWPPERIGELQEQFSRIFAMCLDHWKRGGRIPLELFRRPSEGTARLEREDVSMCGAGDGAGLVVDVDGRAHACTFLADSYQEFETEWMKRIAGDLEMGPIAADGFAERRRTLPDRARRFGVFHHKERKRSSYGNCGECPYLTECVVCPLSIARVPGNTDPDRVPDFSCAFYRSALEQRDRFPALPSRKEEMMGRGTGPTTFCALARSRQPS